MKAWIFQGKPERYDVADANLVKEGETEVWLASRYHEQMHPGDIVYLWRSGDASKRGVYAWGRIVGEAEYHEDWGWGVPVRYERRLPNHIAADSLRADRRLSEHLLFRMPIGTNFPLEGNEAGALRETVVTASGAQYAPPEVE